MFQVGAHAIVMKALEAQKAENKRLREQLATSVPEVAEESEPLSPREQRMARERQIMQEHAAAASEQAAKVEDFAVATQPADKQADQDDEHQHPQQDLFASCASEMNSFEMETLKKELEQAEERIGSLQLEHAEQQSAVDQVNADRQVQLKTLEAENAQYRMERDVLQKQLKKARDRSISQSESNDHEDDLEQQLETVVKMNLELEERQQQLEEAQDVMTAEYETLEAAHSADKAEIDQLQQELSAAQGQMMTSINTMATDSAEIVQVLQSEQPRATEADGTEKDELGEALIDSQTQLTNSKPEIESLREELFELRVAKDRMSDKGQASVSDAEGHLLSPRGATEV